MKPRPLLPAARCPAVRSRPWRRQLALLACLGLMACAGAETTDDQGDSAAARPSPVANSGAAADPAPVAQGPVRTEPEDDAAQIYDPEAFHTFELRVTESNLATLDADPAAEIYVPGTLIFDGEEYGPVGVRYKGSVGAWISCTEGTGQEGLFDIGGQRICPKLSLKVSFNWVDPEGRFFGMKKLLFHAMNNDPSMMRERLGYQLFRKMQAPAPRAAHVRLRVNGKLAGVFLNVEDIDGRFTRAHFEDGKGNLYKEVWPTYSDQQVATGAAEFLAALQTNEDDDPSVQRLVDFGREVMDSEGEARAEVIRRWMSVEHTMAMIAVDRTIRADDGLFHFYCGRGLCNNHNFFLYEEQDEARLWVIPWDLDNAFVVQRGEGFTGDGFLTVVNEWDAPVDDCAPQEGAIPQTPPQLPPSCDPLIAGWGSFRGEYERQVANLLDGPFSLETEQAELSAWRGQIADSVAEAYDANPQQLSPEQWEAAMLDLMERTAILRGRAAAGIGR